MLYMKKISTLILVGAVSLAAKGDVLVDSLTSGSTAAYNQTVILAQNGDGPLTFTSTGSGLQVSRVFTSGGAAQQDLLLLNSYSLSVGDTLQVSITGLGTSAANADFGIAIASQANPISAEPWVSGTASSRSNYLAMYVKPGSSQVGSIGFNGTTQLYSSGGVTPGAGVYATITGLWITEVAANKFSDGYTTTSGNVTLGSNIQFTGADIGQAVGFYADLRGTLTSAATLDNLTIVPEPSTIALCGVGALGLVAGLRRKK